MVGKSELAMDALSVGTADGEYAIAVSPGARADRLLANFEGDAERLWVIDCSGSTGAGSFEDRERVKYVASPGDLTGLGIGVAKATQGIGPGAENGLKLGVLSVSTLLQYAETDRVFNLLHVLTGRIAAGDYLGVFTLDPTAHDDETSNVITSQFDAVLEVRDIQGGRECRVRGLPDVDREWRPL